MRRTEDDRWERARDSENFVVEVKITNGTDRAYLLKAHKVSLRAESGERVRPLETSEDSPTPCPHGPDHCARRRSPWLSLFPTWLLYRRTGVSHWRADPGERGF